MGDTDEGRPRAGKPDTLMDPVSPLSSAERRCLELAWVAWGRGTVPVGAVVTDPTGRLLLEGRSRMYERDAPPGELANSLLAHAEVNALGRLDPERRHESLTLTTSLEPCPLCLGAAAMATVGHLAYLGADPYGGAVGRLQPTAHTSRVPLRVAGPRPDAFGLLASAMHVAFFLRRRPDGHVVATHRLLAPDVVTAAEVLIDLGAAERASSGEPLPDELAEALEELTDARHTEDRKAGVGKDRPV